MENGNKVEGVVSNPFIKGLRTVLWLVFFGITIFWISEVLATYFSYPVNTAVTLVENDSFTLPSITICLLSSNFYWTPCYNKTTIEKYNITNLSPDTIALYYKFLEKAKYETKEDALGQSKCLYFHSDNTDIIDCENSISSLGSWNTH